MPDQWDQFLARILSPEDKLLFEEAIRSARAGALRAGYIMTWISCAESLKRKFRELSPRDGTAKGITGECERKELAHQSIDHFLLEKAKDYGLITATEFTKLEQIYIFRCVYGHPYEVGPTELNLLSAASDVVDLVLSKTTKLRHGYLSTQIDHLTTRASFLDDRYQSVERFANEVAQKCDATLHWWFLEKLWEKAESFSTDKSMELFFRRALWFSVAYLKHILDPASTNLQVVNYLVKYQNILAQVFSTPVLFRLIDNHSRELIVGTVVQHSTMDARHVVLLKTLNDASCLDEHLQQRFWQAVDACSIEDLAAAKIDPNLFVERIISKLKSHDWYAQNPAIEVVNNVGREGISQLNATDQFRLGNNILQSADGGANRAISFLASLANSTDQWPEKLIEGIVTECFINDNNLIRFKTERLRSALRCIKRMDATAIPPFFDRLTERIKNGRAKSAFGMQGRSEALGILQQFASENGDLVAKLNDLVTALNAVETPDVESLF
jgi:hypothetical protein